jgi:hypothetical protein
MSGFQSRNGWRRVLCGVTTARSHAFKNDISSACKIDVDDDNGALTRTSWDTAFGGFWPRHDDDRTAVPRHTVSGREPVKGGDDADTTRISGSCMQPRKRASQWQ